MSDDDVYINAGDSYDADTTYYATEPQERKESDSKAAAITAASYPVMAAVADWFASQVQDAPDIINVQVGSITHDGVEYSRKVSIEAQVLAYQLYQEKMIEKAREFESWRSEQV